MSRSVLEEVNLGRQTHVLILVTRENVIFKHLHKTNIFLPVNAGFTAFLTMVDGHSGNES
jgi:hypothetical protein